MKKARRSAFGDAEGLMKDLHRFRRLIIVAGNLEKMLFDIERTKRGCKDDINDSTRMMLEKYPLNYDSFNPFCKFTDKQLDEFLPALHRTILAMESGKMPLENDSALIKKARKPIWEFVTANVPLEIFDKLEEEDDKSTD